MKRAVLGFLIIFLYLVITAQYLDWGKWKGYNKWAISDEATTLALSAPALNLDTLGTDSMVLALTTWDTLTDSFFVRWDTTAYPSSKTAGDSLLTGVLADTVNEIRFEYDLMTSSQTVYVRCFVESDTATNTYSSTYKTDTFAPDTFSTTPTLATLLPNADTVFWKPSEISARDIDSLLITRYEMSEGGTVAIGIPWATALADSDTIVASDLLFTATDTTEIVRYILTLFDGLGNSVSMNPIYDTLKINHPTEIDVSYAYIDNDSDGVLDTVNATFKPATWTDNNIPWYDSTDCYILPIILKTSADGCTNYDYGFGTRSIWESGAIYSFHNIMTDSIRSITMSGCNTEDGDLIYSFYLYSFTGTYNGYTVNISSPIMGMDSSETMIAAPVEGANYARFDSTIFDGSIFR